MFKVYIHKTQNEKEAGIKRRKTNEPSKLLIDPAFLRWRQKWFVTSIVTIMLSLTISFQTEL